MTVPRPPVHQCKPFEVEGWVMLCQFCTKNYFERISEVREEKDASLIVRMYTMKASSSCVHGFVVKLSSGQTP
jgi:hypothetical protein